MIADFAHQAIRIVELGQNVGNLLGSGELIVEVDAAAENTLPLEIKRFGKPNESTTDRREAALLAEAALPIGLCDGAEPTAPQL